MHQIINEISQFLPLSILAIQEKDSILLLSGENWEFSTAGTWRLIKNNLLEIACYDDASDKIFSRIKGLFIVDIKIQAKKIAFDPVFLLSDSSQIEFFSFTCRNTWTFRAPSGKVYEAKLE